MSTSAPRNILILQSDQHRGDWMGCAGADWVHTPNLDALAARGVRFSQAYCSYPLCGPSRMSFLTGLHPYRNGMHTNEESLPSSTPTYAHTAGLAGFHTVLCGRMHFCGPDQRHGFHERIFGDYNPSYMGGLRAKIPEHLGRASGGAKHSVQIAETMERNYFLDFDEGVTRAAERYLTEYATRDDAAPLLLNVGWFLPHSPFAAPEAYVSRARERAAKMPPPYPRRTDSNAWEDGFLKKQDTGAFSPEDYTETRIQYAAMIDYLDDRIGRVIVAAQALPGETLVIYHSDHGELAGDHNVVHKGCLDESSLHVPLIIADLKADARTVANPDRVVDAPISLVDLAPTVSDYSGAELVPLMDGRSLRPCISGGVSDETPIPTRDVFAEVEIHKDLPPARMCRRRDLKYCYYHGIGETIFNIAKDPMEQTNLAADPAFATIKAEMKDAVLNGWNPEMLAENCQRIWQNYHYLRRWGNQVGQKLWSSMEVWMGDLETTGIDGC